MNDEFLKLRKQFPLLKNYPNLIYFDNGATTLKPNTVINAEINYLKNISTNPHSTDYKIGYKALEVLNNTREIVKKFINANKTSEIVFTSGTTQSINMIAKGLVNLINKDDEILITSLEHSSNLVPWIWLKQKTNAVIKNLELNDEFGIDINKLDQIITSKTKIVSFAHMSNTTGYTNDVKKIVQKIRSINKNVIIVVDVAQSIAHFKVDVIDWDVDFIAFSAHKMYGPFGIGILYGKYEWLDKLEPLNLGGGSSLAISKDFSSYTLKTLPEKLEAGTLNISAICSFKKAIEFILKIGIDKIHSYEASLKQYVVKKIKENHLDKKITFYNLNNNSPLLLFNVNQINAQDISTFLDVKYNITSRSGAHCVRRLEDVIHIKTALRISFAIYNTKSEIDQLILALKNTDKFLDIYF
ncbi:aminotransferase class V-fold PLP-dependent enzyme [Mycoplasma feriruminatoris]|uniref:cysteine desulfurase n=2 Tax=Mycoplasma feriruminatoris TaxID=1179777 RepID=A0A654IRK9_9MOLU|nr:aminotransferase class V-fold PLP-dependent enzyme [Mycoplasma feriruminatoris]WFQ90172.1 Cysteine desulfurase SufS [Mycoplasma feriruminatoris]VZS00201.1 Cysteine desulfurase SufS [Mycoplasma feriruminatoris]